MQEVTIQVTVGLGMADNGLDRRSSSQFALDLAVHAALLTGPEDPVRVVNVMAAIAFVDIDAFDMAPSERFGLLDDLFERVPIIWISMQCLGVEDERKRPAFPPCWPVELAVTVIGSAGSSRA